MKKKKGIFNRKKFLVNTFRFCSSTYFLTYKGTLDSGITINKIKLANYLLNQNQKQFKLKPKKYLICEQRYDSGLPHFHVILIYQKRKQITLQDHYDYLGIHPNIQPMRNLKAALEYVYKEDPNPITNMDVAQQLRKARAKNTVSFYELLREEMIKDPINFNAADYCFKHDLDRQICKTNFNKSLKLLNFIQSSAARAFYADKPGIKFITPNLISQRLNKAQIKQFYSHPCYQKIVDHINQIYKYPNRDLLTMAPSKTPHLLIVGHSSIGKSALVDHRATQKHPYPGLMFYYACYHMSIGQKFFPPYRSFDYQLVRWNQFTINSDLFPKNRYHRLLDYLEGAPSALPQKGKAAIERQDNPKHILTSNRTLEEHICKTFNNQQSRAMSRENLGSRIDCVVIPLGKNIHFLRKLFVSN